MTQKTNCNFTFSCSSTWVDGWTSGLVSVPIKIKTKKMNEISSNRNFSKQGSVSSQQEAFGGSGRRLGIPGTLFSGQQFVGPTLAIQLAASSQHRKPTFWFHHTWFIFAFILQDSQSQSWIVLLGWVTWVVVIPIWVLWLCLSIFATEFASHRVWDTSSTQVLIPGCYCGASKVNHDPAQYLRFRLFYKTTFSPNLCFSSLHHSFQQLRPDNLSPCAIFLLSLLLWPQFWPLHVQLPLQVQLLLGLVVILLQ